MFVKENPDGKKKKEVKTRKKKLSPTGIDTVRIRGGLENIGESSKSQDE